MILHSVTPDRAYLVDDDPVRPNISYAFRISNNKDFFVYENELTADAAACICVSYNDQVPTNMSELIEFPNFADEPRIAVFYTVWSYEKGAGRDIVFKTVEWIKENKPHICRFVTLSPKTKMAERFHLRNGAVLLSENKESNNFEYRNV
jgi:hypothetical protein|tara:strand:- start:1015 stop:1461 length:447 start_codon:yes stop_codon:yes gene_type:complete